MLGWLRRTPFPDRVEIDGREAVVDADAVLRPGGPPCPRLSRCAGCASSRTRPRSTRARWDRRRTSRVLRFAPDDALAIGAHRRRPRRPARHRRTGAPASSARGSPLDDVGGATSSGRSRRAPGPRPGLLAGVPAKVCLPDGTAAPRRRRPAADGHGLRRRARGPAADERVRRDAARPIRWHEPKSSYDVVIIGGGGHGLSTAYYLATRHGITNVAVLEADYIASGNTGRNTTIIRANYGIPEAIRFYQHSLELYQGLEAETGADDPPPDQGHLLGRPHGDGDAHRAGALPDEHGLRGEDVHGHARPSSRSSSRRST